MTFPINFTLDLPRRSDCRRAHWVSMSFWSCTVAYTTLRPLAYNIFTSMSWSWVKKMDTYLDGLVLGRVLATLLFVRFRFHFFQYGKRHRWTQPTFNHHNQHSKETFPTRRVVKDLNSQGFFPAYKIWALKRWSKKTSSPPTKWKGSVRDNFGHPSQPPTKGQVDPKTISVQKDGILMT